ncbi:YfbU family protein [Promicromonospora soli]
MLAQRHRILAKLATDGDPHGDLKYHERQAEVLVHGFVSEYATAFAVFEDELVQDDCRYVISVLSMFAETEHGFRELSLSERKQLGADAGSRLQFSGFDGNGSREGRMMGFARYQIERGQWSDLAPRFASFDSNSHMPVLDIYGRRSPGSTPGARHCAGRPGGPCVRGVRRRSSGRPGPTGCRGGRRRLWHSTDRRP